MSKGEFVYCAMWPSPSHSDVEMLSVHASLDDAKEAVMARIPEVLWPVMFWNDDGVYSHLLANEPFPYPLPHVRRRELT